MRIVHMTSVHPALDTRIFFRECRTLVEAGHEVVLIARHGENDVVDGIRIRVIGSSKRHLRTIPATLKEIYKMAKEENADAYHFHDPELIPVGLLLKLKGKIVIYDVHEDYPASLRAGRYWINPGLSVVISKLTALAENIGAKSFTRIVAATPHIARRFPKNKTTVIQNFPRISELAYDVTNGYHERGPLIAYVGVISLLRGVKEMITACDFLPRELGAELFMAGSFSPASLEKEVAGINGWGRVTCLGMQKRNEVASLLGKARVGLVLFHRAPNHTNSQPNKIFEYMSAGIPIIASDFPLWKEIVEGTKCGVCVDPLDSRSIADALKWILEHPIEAEQMGKRGKEAVEKYYNWNSESKKLLYLYQNIQLH